VRPSCLLNLVLACLDFPPPVFLWLNHLLFPFSLSVLDRGVSPRGSSPSRAPPKRRCCFRRYPKSVFDQLLPSGRRSPPSAHSPPLVHLKISFLLSQPLPAAPSCQQYTFGLPFSFFLKLPGKSQQHVLVSSSGLSFSPHNRDERSSTFISFFSLLVLAYLCPIKMWKDARRCVRFPLPNRPTCAYLRKSLFLQAHVSSWKGRSLCRFRRTLNKDYTLLFFCSADLSWSPTTPFLMASIFSFLTRRHSTRNRLLRLVPLPYFRPCIS